MQFPEYSYSLQRPIEDIYLPGDADIYAPVVLRTRRRRWTGRIAQDDLNLIDQILYNLEQNEIYSRTQRRRRS